ncbi:MAG: amidohydrolase family protein [bacterium]|nr:amidohydrolase family protein [bacterium]
MPIPDHTIPKAPNLGGTPRIEVNGDAGSRLLLKSGLIVDGTGQSPYWGDLLIQDGIIEELTPGEIDFHGQAIDCAGKVIAPGFIDMHSHMDWVLPVRNRPELTSPFTAQGITTFVTGNCGYGVAGFRPNSEHRALFERRVDGLYPMTWDTMEEYLQKMRAIGITNNTATLAGLGTSRASISGYHAGPLAEAQLNELLGLVGDAMDQGAHGVSLGLGYEPGMFATEEELKRVAELVQAKDKILTVHMKAYSALSGTYPLKMRDTPHNLQAIEDMLNLARETGVRLQLSHLIFVGSRTWETVDHALAMIDDARAEGLDVMFDTYAHNAGNSIVNVFMPTWFLAKGPDAFKDKGALRRLRLEVALMKKLVGFGYDDIQLTNGCIDELNQYNGLFMTEIAEKRGMSNFKNLVDIARQTKGKARVLNHSYSTPEHVRIMMQHPASLFQTDAVVAHTGIQNPGCYGTFPRFLQYARDDKLMTLEQVIHKMTGAPADRFRLADRGRLKRGLAADITVFDWHTVRDNTTNENTSAAPTGIEHVILNGQIACAKGRVDTSILPGQVL